MGEQVVIIIGGPEGGDGNPISYRGVPYKSKGLGGFPTSMYTGSSKLGDFSIRPEVYDFGVPSPVPNLERLREVPDLDLDKAKELLLMPAGGQRSVSSTTIDIKEEQPDTVPPAGIHMGGERSVAANGSGTSQPATPYPKPNWGLAKELFIPKI